MSTGNVNAWPRGSAGSVVLTGHVPLIAVPAQVESDWQRDSQQLLALEPGDVEPLPLARTRMRWPGCKQAMDAAWQWMTALGMGEARTSSDVALMACRGAPHHHDGERYGDKAFLNLFLTDNEPLDLYFPVIDVRIPLRQGTIVLFDTYQPHTVVAKNKSTFDPADFSPPHDRAQVFLTWEVPISNAEVARQLAVTF